MTTSAWSQSNAGTDETRKLSVVAYNLAAMSNAKGERKRWGAYASPHVGFGVSPNTAFPRDAGNCRRYAGRCGTRALPRDTERGIS